MRSDEASQNAIVLPETLETTLLHINNLMQAFNLPRDILASDEEIGYAWKELPREIKRIPVELRNESIVKMCVAASVGLFDGAINYVWNAVIVALRSKVSHFGLSLVAEIAGNKFEEKDLKEMTDAALLDLCYKLQLLSEDGYLFLNQCRDMRNNFSSAHPSIAKIDDRELINFISRCCKYGLTNEISLMGIDVSDFYTSVKGHKLEEGEIEFWKHKFLETFPAQRQLLVPSLMGIYCDPDSAEYVRLNALKICISIQDVLDDKTKSKMIENYSSYYIKGHEEKCIAARALFEKLHMLNLLSSAEQHSILKNACANLLRVHLGFNNFYNEPPFAQRLCELTSKMQTPESVQQEFVYAVMMGYVGNPYGVSTAAEPYYVKLILGFSPKEVNFMFHLMEDKMFASRMKMDWNRKRYIHALELIDKESMTPKQLPEYDKLIERLKGAV